jgi:glycosyltransferase involved in cell wall biosynthesis
MSTRPAERRAPLRVAFDARPASDPHGIGRYTRALLFALREEAGERGGEVVEAHRPRRVDVFHSPWLEGALLRPRLPMVVTLHNLFALKRPGRLLREGLSARMRALAVQRAAQLIVPSQAVADDVAELLRYDVARIHVIPEAADRAFTPRTNAEVAAVRARYGLSSDYLLWVGGLRHPDPRRRVAALVDAPRELPLVLVGEPGQWARELEGVTLTGAVGDDELAALYTGARALVLPSDDEGFGLPAVEALACGTPVVACELPALREVLGQRATFVAQGDLGALMVAAHAASRPAPAPPIWSWADAADATWTVYERAVASGAPA